MKKTFLLVLALLCSSLAFSWEFEKEGNIVTILPNSKSTTVSSYKAAPWFNDEIDTLHIVLADGITGVRENTFAGSKNIVSVTVADTVETIGADAFRGCEKLSEIILQPTLKSIGSRAFQDCPLLKNVKIPSNNIEISDDAFDADCYLAKPKTIQRVQRAVKK